MCRGAEDTGVFCVEVQRRHPIEGSIVTKQNRSTSIALPRLFLTGALLYRA